MVNIRAEESAPLRDATACGDDSLVVAVLASTQSLTCIRGRCGAKAPKVRTSGLDDVKAQATSGNKAQKIVRGLPSRDKQAES
ncbi:hypothetical protein Nepgr_026688 [Nepenthes gracilis]|uniref:Uncharacterized protein n=1 Tax=Nepenthes gracilis TaxID=150966 RepID=A0AAD3T7C3_NEPGR|nr:hypothetical protein Nepgr_026688 [Nepenthes gracilis]